MTSQGAKKTKRLLKSYLNTYPRKTSEIITEAIFTGDKEKLRDITTSLDAEIRDSGEENKYYVRQWRLLCKNLIRVTTSYTELRKYEDGKTPDDVKGSETVVVRQGAMTTYKLRDDEYAVLVSQAPVESELSSSRGEFKLVFVESPAVFFENKLRPNNWYRPKDVS